VDGAAVTLPPLRLVDPHQATRAIGRLEAVSTIALLVASGEAQSKSALVRATGMPRPTVSAAVESLVARGILVRQGVIGSDRGRPAERIEVAPSAGLVLVADVGVAHTTLAVADLNLRLLAHGVERLVVPGQDPDDVLAGLTDRLRDLAQRCAPGVRPAVAVLGLPARIDTSTGRAVRPPLLPGWDDYDAVGGFSRLLGCPVAIENDVNLRALGEAAALPADQRPLLLVKLGTGIGAGIIDATGDVYHGSDGSAGEIGHTPIGRFGQRQCYCGNSGCLEIVAGVPGMLARLRELTQEADAAECVEDVVARLRAGDPAAVTVVSEAGRACGEVLAPLCNTLNPRRLVITGVIPQASDELLAAIRTTVYRYARPLATRNLLIGPSVLGGWAGVAGGLVLGAQYVFGPHALRRLSAP